MNRFAKIMVGSAALGAAVWPVDVQAQIGTPTAVDVRMNEWHFGLSKQTLKAGKIRITATDRGKVAHELIVIRTDLASNKLPFFKAKDRFNEAATSLAKIGEIENVKPGKVGTKTFDLKPGHYVFACNVAGHYRQGMHIDITVR